MSGANAVRGANFIIGETKTKHPGVTKEIRLHTHPEYEIHLFLQGNTKYIVEEKVYRVEPYDMIIIRKNQLHCLYRHIPSQAHRIILGVAPDFFVENNCVEYEAQFLDESTRLNNKIPAHIVKSSGLLDAFMRLKKYSKDYTVSKNSPIIKIIIVEILYLINKCSEFAEADDSNESIKQVITYLNDNYTKDITLDELCNMFYLSKYYLCRLFRKATGLTVFEYVRKKRLAMVNELTKKGVNKTEAAMKAGFTNYTAFYRAYKTEFDTSPREGLRYSQKNEEEQHENKDHK